MTGSDQQHDQVTRRYVERYPHDGSVLEKTGWWFNYGPQLFVVISTIAFVAGTIRLIRKTKAVFGRE